MVNHILPKTGFLRYIFCRRQCGSNLNHCDVIGPKVTILGRITQSNGHYNTKLYCLVIEARLLRNVSQDCNLRPVNPSQYSFISFYRYFLCLQFQFIALLCSSKGSEDGMVKLWNLEISDFTANLRGHQGTVSCVDIAPDEAFVVSGSSSDRSVKIWSIIMSCIITDYRV